ncbi:MAG TPA: GTPase Era [Solirubrobacteraceae bacterium]|jgi:GTP-binding protein Era|nr:GTPase Era [Solirubrobacteraceae bacterium]
MTRAGFVALAGRPNVGKSTLVNAVVGGKVAIVSDRAQTTRRAIRGVRTTADCQLVLVDLPGVQRPRDALTARMSQRVREELHGADASLLVLNGEQGVGPGDRFIAQTLLASQSSPAELPHRPDGEDDDAERSGPEDAQRSAAQRAPLTIALNKVDRLSRAETLTALRDAAQLDTDAEVFPISARTGTGVSALVVHLEGLLPECPLLFAADTRTDQSRSLMAAELIREAAIRRTYRELPHALEVMVEEIEPLRADLLRVRALIWVESDSQRVIVVGAGGRMIKAIGSAAREELERELGKRVHLDLSVRVRRDWRGDEGLLDRLGIE